MHVLLRTDATLSQARTGLIVARLRQALPAASIDLQLLPRGEPLPAALEALLKLECVLFRAQPPIVGLETQPAARITDTSTRRWDLVIDLAQGAALDASENASGHAARHLRVRYDCAADPAAVYIPLLEGDAPVLEVEDATTGRVLARGRPCTDGASGLADAADYVFARVGVLLEAALLRPQDLKPLPADHAHSWRTGAAIANEMRRLSTAVARKIYRLCCHEPHWQIGWRFNDGPGVAERGNLSGPLWQALPDNGARFYADPFPIARDGRHYIFFEDYSYRLQKGIISYVEIGADGPVGPVRPVLEEPWHLSYPLLVEQDGNLFMIPEASSNREVAIYRAERFPDRWVSEGALISGSTISDATPVHHGGRWFMFASESKDGGSYSDTLAIFMADRLLGPWSPHPANPILVDPHGARPAGPCVMRDGKLWRVTQSCEGGYGSALCVAEVMRLDESGFEQVVRTIIRNDKSWPGHRLHTLTRWGRLECIDGSAHAPRARWVAGASSVHRGRHELDE